ncbi:MAG TPA: preprotein translocase subunit SecG [Candidatus Binataceae bacterium]|nr:preprotein translocase subunit SecG [Candidatus Binataceae bacterium]
MIALVIAIHVTICVVLTVVVLLQQGKGADVGAVFGGSSQTVFGSSGAGNLLTRVTSGLAVAFFATSMFLAYASTKHVTSSIFDKSSRSAAPSKAAPAKPAPAPAPAGGGFPGEEPFGAPPAESVPGK